MTRTVIKLLAGSALLPIVSAHAQVAGGGEYDAARREIVVTAQFRPQDPIDVPITLTAFDGEVLDRIGVQDFEELARLVPGLQVANESPIAPGFVLRGISSAQGPAYNEPRVSVFQDGVSIEAFVENLFDKEYLRDAGNTGDALGLPTAVPGTPRTYGVTGGVVF